VKYLASKSAGPQYTRKEKSGKQDVFGLKRSSLNNSEPSESTSITLPHFESLGNSFVFAEM
jgi:hypothetical protein